jgi:hypothetical protein
MFAVGSPGTCCKHGFTGNERRFSVLCGAWVACLRPWHAAPDNPEACDVPLYAAAEHTLP